MPLVMVPKLVMVAGFGKIERCIAPKHVPALADYDLRSIRRTIRGEVDGEIIGECPDFAVDANRPGSIKACSDACRFVDYERIGIDDESVGA